MLSDISICIDCEDKFQSYQIKAGWGALPSYTHAHFLSGILYIILCFYENRELVLRRSLFSWICVTNDLLII